MAHDTPEFKSWFAGSKVTSPDGQPLRVFHGTSKDRDFSSFKIGRRGAWFTASPDDASKYAAENDSQSHKWDGSTMVATNTAPRVIPAHLALKNPYKMSPADLKAHSQAPNYKAYQAQLFDQLRAKGHDGVDFGSGTWVAFHPHQIKSIFNSAPTEAAHMSKAVLDPASGYSFQHEHDPRGVDHRVQAFHGGKWVGEATFQHIQGNEPFMKQGGFTPNTLYVLQTDVHPEHRRRGLASAIYAHAEKMSGLKVAPSNDQTHEAKALWAANAKNPQFGKSMIQPLGKSQREKNLRQVASVAAFKDGKILMGLRGDVEKWCLPGGHLEPGESPAKGAVRELLEETGLKATSLERLGSAIVGKNGNVQVHCYRADVDGSPDASNDPDAEMIEFRWVDPDDLPEDVLANLYNKQDVTLQLLGAQPKSIDLSKASLAEIMARTKATADHMRALAQSGASSHVFPHPSGGTVVVARDPSKPEKYRATRIDATGEPIGHVEAEDIHGAIRHAHSYGADVHAVQPIQKSMGEWLAKAMKPEHFRSILNAVTSEGRNFVDHKTQLHAHPMDMAPSVEHYENNLKAHPQVFKPTKGSRDEGVTRKLVFNSRDQSIDHNVFDHPDKYMVKPYHEGIVRRVASWQKYPIQGWAEMAHQALYHAAGIGHLHQKVHVSEHDMKSPKLGHQAGEPALVVHMENGMQPIFNVHNIIKEPGDPVGHDAMKIGLMDFLTNNLDRHHGNLLVENQEQPKLPPEANAPQWLRDETVNKVSKVMAIDHSRSFQYVNNHHHKWDSQAKIKKNRQLEDSIRPYLFGGNSWRPAVAELIERPRTHDQKVSFLQTHAKPLFDWWEKSSPKIRAAFHDQLQHIKNPEARDHLKRNFEERARWLDERSDLGIDNYGTDWYDDPVAQYHPDQKTDGEREAIRTKEIQEQYARDLAELNGKRGAA